ncbi:MAG: lipoyl domain-containing protein [Boseongicola sp.]|nr:lipoyl domain-containing protein [Boseongicola sp.]MDE0697667.1 lipoyl domain-containing protein [Boseongicola sp.]
MKAELKLARIGLNMEEGTVTKQRVAAGDRFKTGDFSYEVVTGKASNEIEAPGDGVTAEVPVGEDEVAAECQDACNFESA